MKKRASQKPVKAAFLRRFPTQWIKKDCHGTSRISSKLLLVKETCRSVAANTYLLTQTSSKTFANIFPAVVERLKKEKTCYFYKIRFPSRPWQNTAVLYFRWQNCGPFDLKIQRDYTEDRTTNRKWHKNTITRASFLFDFERKRVEDVVKLDFTRPSTVRVCCVSARRYKFI